MVVEESGLQLGQNCREALWEKCNGWIVKYLWWILIHIIKKYSG